MINGNRKAKALRGINSPLKMFNPSWSHIHESALEQPSVLKPRTREPTVIGDVQELTYSEIVHFFKQKADIREIEGGRGGIT